jgi:hypothetical protein
MRIKTNENKNKSKIITIPSKSLLAFAKRFGEAW